MEFNAEAYLLGGIGSGIRGATQGKHHSILEPTARDSKVKVKNPFPKLIMTQY